MIKLSEKQRTLYGEKIVDFAHLAMGGLVFGQSVSDKGVSLIILIIGLGMTFLGYTISYLLTVKPLK